MAGKLSFKGIGKFLRRILSIRNDLPKDLEKDFEEFKDIKSIDRIEIASWIGFILTLLLFILDYIRWKEGMFEEEPKNLQLFYVHMTGLLFIVMALHINKNKKWIIQTRLRRGIVIWSMVALALVFVMTQTILSWQVRKSMTMYMAFIFMAGWMFSMSHKERILFTLGTLSLMVYFILDSALPAERTLAYLYEVVFLSIIAFYFDAFDYNLKVFNFMSIRRLEEDQGRIRKLEEFKSRFFTNLTHELRTPLTLISGMAKEIGEDPKRWATEGSEIITRNSGNLLNLINQILDLSKIENGSLQIRMIKGDIVSYIGFLVDAFKGHAFSKKIQLHFLSDEEEIIMDYDADKYLTILSNLLSNAIKFTPEGGNIYVHLTTHRTDGNTNLEIMVRDTGIGIPQEALPHIFERFYQAENNGQVKGIGTGIGLSVVSELVKLLNGDIKVKSSSDKGTQFNLLLPITTKAETLSSVINKERINQDIKDFYAPLNVDEMEEIILDSGEKPEVLIIEDNQDVMKFLQVCLGDLFQLSFAHDGQEGITKAIETVPDLVLSDVMMPVKDGLAVCRELKLHQCTSHIPIVLLSAKSDLDSRVAGLESGADVYMLKPFEKRELRAQLNTLLEKRQEQQARYADPSVPLEKEVDAVKAKEDEFVVRVRNIISEHLDDADFSVMHLCRAIYLSRTQLHKKLKALTGQSASLFIRQIRLYAGMNLLKTTDLNINEIAYQVGFDDPNYFSRCFAQEFGSSPSETRK